MKTENRESDNFIVIWLGHGDLWDEEEYSSKKFGVLDRFFLELQKLTYTLISRAYTFIVDKKTHSFEVRIKLRGLPEKKIHYDNAALGNVLYLQDRERAQLAISIGTGKEIYLLTKKEDTDEAEEFADKLSKALIIGKEYKKIIKSLNL